MQNIKWYNIMIIQLHVMFHMQEVIGRCNYHFRKYFFCIRITRTSNTVVYQKISLLHQCTGVIRNFCITNKQK